MGGKARYKQHVGPALWRAQSRARSSNSSREVAQGQRGGRVMHGVQEMGAWVVLGSEGITDDSVCGVTRGGGKQSSKRPLLHGWSQGRCSACAAARLRESLLLARRQEKPATRQVRRCPCLSSGRQQAGVLAGLWPPSKARGAAAAPPVSRPAKDAHLFTTQGRWSTCTEETVGSGSAEKAAVGQLESRQSVSRATEHGGTGMQRRGLAGQGGAAHA